MVYLSQLFNSLNARETYRSVRPAFQIDILNFTLFPAYPEFLSTYQMSKTKNYHKYSDKFIIHVLDLNQIHLASGEDRAHDREKWAQLFHALTWEDFKMILAGNKSIQEVVRRIRLSPN